jgi:predicted TPR repeat methyltransferase
MPIGSFTVIPHVAKHLTTAQPRRVLDLGIGSGFYGAVVRQWVDLGVRPWRTFLAGVEAWADYRNPLWDLYNLVVVDSIQNYLARFHERFDCVIMGDVLEHFETAEGAEVLDQVQARVAPGGTLIVATPAVFVDQAAEYGNELERHRSIWSAAELEALGFTTVLSGAEAQVALAPTVLSFWRNSHSQERSACTAT